MKKRGKLKQFLIAMIVVVMGVSVMLPVQAATRRYVEETVYADIPSSVSTDFGHPYIIVSKYETTVAYYDIRILNRKGKIIRFKRTNFGWKVFYGLKKNQLYYYQIRKVYTYDPDTEIDATEGNWTVKVPFVLAEYPVSQVGVERKVRIKMPKIQGVKDYKIYMSYKNNKEWKKLKTVKAGNSIIISKFKGKTLRKKKYYYKIVPSKGVNETIGCIKFSK